MADWSRRTFLLSTTAATAASVMGTEAVAAADAVVKATGATGGNAGWLDGTPPAAHEGMTWGQPWPRGTRLADAYRVRAGGATLPVQSWPLAWWPDGSIKWTGHAVPADAALAADLRVETGKAGGVGAAVRVTERGDAIEVVVGDTVWTIGRSGASPVTPSPRTKRLAGSPSKIRLCTTRTDAESAWK